MSRRDILPFSLPPRGLSREEAAAYYSVSPGSFDKIAEAHGLKPRRMAPTNRLAYDRVELDALFSALPHDGEVDGDEVWSEPAV